MVTGQCYCYSSEKIPFNSTIALQHVYHLLVTQRTKLVQDIFSQLSSGVLHCPKCNSHAMTEVPVVMKSVLLVMVSGTAETEVSVKRCPQCKFVLGIDGKAAGFINLGHYMVCHEVLRRYLYYFFSGRSTLFTEYQVLKKYTEDYGDRTFGDKFSYTYFKWAWYSFLDLLDINFEEGFFCPDCGDYPDSFVMDATSVSFRKELACWSSLASEKRKPPKPPSAKEKKLRRDERALLPLSVREPFSMLVKKGGLLKDMIPMIMSLVSQDCPNYAGLLQTIIDCAGVKEDRLFVAHPWEDFAKCLVSPYLACSFITTDPAVHSVLRRLNRDTRGNMHDLSILQHNIPSLFQLLQELKDNFPYSAMQKVTDTMIGRSMAPFGKSNEVTEGMEMDTTENISYFPTMKVVRGRGLYSCDKDIGKAKECSKMSRGHPSLLPGIFTLFCTHGVCYGFEVMKYHESPNLPFTILRSRCKEAPSLVVYDNACNLHQYCINRDPDFFKNTTFRVDALHFKNHKACGTSYKLKAYPQHKKLNSQVVEQANSRIQRIKSQLSYMTQTNFVNHCKLFLWAQNKAAIQK